MFLHSLINHSAQLFDIIWKSNSPSDAIASEYLRKKKYIGSNDRKFISATVFATLRAKLTSDLCIDNLKIQRTYEINEQNINILRITSILFISLRFPEKRKLIEIDSLMHHFQKILDDNNYSLLIETLSELLNISQYHGKSILDSFENTMLFLSSCHLNLTGNDKNSISLDDVHSLEALISMPTNLINKLSKNRSINYTIQVAEAMLFPAKVCLRVANTTFNVENTRLQLNSESIFSKPGNISPVCIILEKRSKITSHSLYTNGILEVQDEGSQIISYCLAPERNACVLDACAGSGGKTLHIASLQNDKGRIIASDVDLKKLHELNKRASRFGYKSIKTVLMKTFSNGKQEVPADFIEGFDYVLVDAPCSGSGTFRRNPKQKYTLTNSLLAKICENQIRILSYYSKFVKPGGIIVYATCSLFADENELIIEIFLRENPDFLPSPLAPILSKYKIKIAGLRADDFYLTLNPAIHETDGFFICRMQKS